jgi:hypothetical protein
MGKEIILNAITIYKLLIICRRLKNERDYTLWRVRNKTMPDKAGHFIQSNL